MNIAMEEIISFYTENPDDDRLSQGLGALEFARTKDILLRHLGGGRQTVLDVGGGTGVYAEWLSELGHETHVVDITPRPGIRSAEVGDARHLRWPDGSVDVLLLLGPLYHLVDTEDRARALAEAHRVLRPGGIAFVAAICRFAPLLASLVEGYFDDPAFHQVLLRELSDGPAPQHDRKSTTIYDGLLPPTGGNSGGNARRGIRRH
jgi:ubiquinone/menaquinone biosynthesis C-methylase UbiE